MRLWSLTCMIMLATTAVASPQLERDLHPDEPDRPQEGVVPEQIVIGFQEQVPRDIAAWLGQLGGTLLFASDETRWISARFASEVGAGAALEAARARDDVAWAEHDRYAQPLGTGEFTPNEALFPQQWGMQAVQAPGAWNVTLGSHDVKIAIVDTGIDAHPDLHENMCGPHTTFDGSMAPRDNHSTMVAGVAAAVTNNGIGVAGMSQSCLMSVKVGTMSGAAMGVMWAAHNGAHIISMSVGDDAPNQALEDAVNAAYQLDVLIVAAAGNTWCDGGTLNTVVWPARYPAVMAVSSVGMPDGSSFFHYSSCGPAVEIAAPGEYVLTTTWGGTYWDGKGTSFAAPHVSGVAALVKTVAPNLTAPEIRWLLNETADDIEEPGWDVKTGWGRVNATAAVLHAVEIANGS